MPGVNSWTSYNTIYPRLEGYGMADRDEFLIALQEFAGPGNVIANWSTEDTLQEVASHLKAIGTKMKALSDNQISESKKKEQAKGSSKPSTPEEKELKGKTKELSSVIDYLSSGQNKLFRGMKDTIGEIQIARSSYGMLSGYLAAATIVVGKLTEIVTEAVQTVQELSNVGYSFSGGLTEMRMAAGRAGMSVTEFAQMLNNNSELVNSLGEKGFMKLAETTSQVRTSLSHFGMTTADANDLAMDYLESQRMAGLLDGMTAKERTQATVDYIGELDQLTTLTGKSRKQISESIKAQTSKVEFTTFLQTVKGASNQVKSSFERVQGALGALGQSAGPLQEAFSTMVTTGLPSTEDAMLLSSGAMGDFGKGIYDLAMRVRSGALSATEAESSIMQLMKSVDSSTMTTVENLARFNPEFRSMAEGMRAVRNAEKDRFKSMDPFTKAWGRLKDVFSQAFERFTKLLDNSPAIQKLFEVLGIGLNKLADFLERVLLGKQPNGEFTDSGVLSTVEGALKMLDDPITAVVAGFGILTPSIWGLASVAGKAASIFTSVISGGGQLISSLFNMKSGGAKAITQAAMPATAAVAQTSVQAGNAASSAASAVAPATKLGGKVIGSVLKALPLIGTAYAVGDLLSEVVTGKGLVENVSGVFSGNNQPGNQVNSPAQSAPNVNQESENVVNKLDELIKISQETVQVQKMVAQGTFDQVRSQRKMSSSMDEMVYITG